MRKPNIPKAEGAVPVQYVIELGAYQRALQKALEENSKLEECVRELQELQNGNLTGELGDYWGDIYSIVDKMDAIIEDTDYD